MVMQSRGEWELAYVASPILSSRSFNALMVMQSRGTWMNGRAEALNAQMFQCLDGHAVPGDCGLSIPLSMHGLLCPLPRTTKKGHGRGRRTSKTCCHSACNSLNPQASLGDSDGPIPAPLGSDCHCR